MNGDNWLFNHGTAVTAVASFLLTWILRSALVPFLDGYSRRKGENLATHKDLDKLVKQMEAVTETQENIKAEISGGLWDRQEQWKLKRDAVLEAIRSIAAIKESLAGLNSCFGTSLPESEALKQKQMVERNAFKETNSNLWCAKFVAESLLVLFSTNIFISSTKKLRKSH